VYGPCKPVGYKAFARFSLPLSVFLQNGEEEEDEEEEGMGPGRSGCKDEDGPIRGRGHRRDGRRESRYADPT
jgi:hypothetical protein